MNGFSLRCLAFCLLCGTMLAGEASGQTQRPEQVVAPPARVLFCADQPVADPRAAETLTPTEMLLVEHVNAQRRRYGLVECLVDNGVQRQARRHASWMAAACRMQHGTTVGENIAKGQRSCAELMNIWMNSSGHRALILNGGCRTIGIAAYKLPRGQIYYCLRMYR
jgi:uncharacterized protein YkwD